MTDHKITKENRMNRSLKWMVPAAAFVVASAGVLAQGPPGGGGPGGGGMPNIPPDVRAKMDANRKWRENHPKIAQIGMTIRGLGEVDKDPATALNKAQAAKI